MPESSPNPPVADGVGAPPSAEAFRQRVAAAILGAGSYRAEWRLLDATAAAGDEGPPLLEQAVVVRGPVHVSVPVGVEFWLAEGVQYRRGPDAGDVEVGPAPANAPRDLLFEFATETIWADDLATEDVVAGDPVAGEPTWLLVDAGDLGGGDGAAIADCALSVSRASFLPVRLEAALGGGHLLRVRFFDFGRVGALEPPPELARLRP